jgi:hypothetical protein
LTTKTLKSRTIELSSIGIQLRDNLVNSVLRDRNAFIDRSAVVEFLYISTTESIEDTTEVKKRTRQLKGTPRSWANPKAGTSVKKATKEPVTIAVSVARQAEAKSGEGKKL